MDHNLSCKIFNDWVSTNNQQVSLNPSENSFWTKIVEEYSNEV